VKPPLRTRERAAARGTRAFAALVGVGALALSSAITIPAAHAASDALIANGTFESGISGWSAPFGGTLAASSDAKSGTASLAISGRTSFQSGPAATVTGLLDPAKSYDLSLAVKFDAGAATQNFNVVLCTSSRSQCDVVTSASVEAGQWKVLEKTFSPAIANYDVLFVETPWNTNVQSFVIDDVSLTTAGTDPGTPVVTEPPAVAGNLLPDGRFVDGFAGWTAARAGCGWATATAATWTPRTN